MPAFRRSIPHALVPAAVLAMLLVSAPSAAAASLPADTTAALSGTPSLLETLPTPVGSADTSSTSISRNGNRVAFVSGSDGLAPDDDDRAVNVYVKDRES